MPSVDGWWQTMQPRTKPCAVRLPEPATTMRASADKALPCRCRRATGNAISPIFFHLRRVPDEKPVPGMPPPAAVFVRKAQIETPAAPEVIAKHYGLTPSELRVLLAVFESGGVSDIAEMLGISESTAKTHLRRLFEKTGTKRQSDLVKVVAGFAGRG